MRMISKDDTISEFPGYTSSKEEKEEDDEEEEEEEEKEESKKKRSKEASGMGSNSEPPVMSPPTRKKFHWGTVFPTRRKRYTDPETGLRIKRTNCKCRIPIELYPCRVEEKLIMRKFEGKWIMKKEMRMISKDGTISEFPGYTSSKEENKEEDEEEEEEKNEEEEKEESKKKRSKEASGMGSNSEPPGYAAIDNEVESDLKFTARSEPKCKKMEDTCESGVDPNQIHFSYSCLYVTDYPSCFMLCKILVCYSMVGAMFRNVTFDF
ncbi:hypothetical protein Tco_0971363 [Tanacetum coccineum]